MEFKLLSVIVKGNLRLFFEFVLFREIFGFFLFEIAFLDFGFFFWKISIIFIESFLCLLYKVLLFFIFFVTLLFY